MQQNRRIFNNAKPDLLGFRALTTYLQNDKVLILTSRDITLKPHLLGEDYYIYTLYLKLRESGVSTDIAVFSKDSVRFYEESKAEKIGSIENIIEGYSTIVLHNMSPFKLLRVKFKYRLKLIMPVNFLWNKCSAVFLNIRWLVGKMFWQLLINRYIATSPTIAKGLKSIGIARKILVIPPTYRCKHCDLTKNTEKLRRLRKRLPLRVKVVYIGSLNPKRFPIADVIDRLHLDEKRIHELDIYTTTPTEGSTYRINNVKINVSHKKLSEAEKCKVLSKSHLFIAPRWGTTMDPSISVMEAEYHGNVVMRI